MLSVCSIPEGFQYPFVQCLALKVELSLVLNTCCRKVLDVLVEPALPIYTLLHLSRNMCGASPSLTGAPECRPGGSSLLTALRGCSSRAGSGEEPVTGQPRPTPKRTRDRPREHGLRTDRIRRTAATRGNTLRTLTFSVPTSPFTSQLYFSALSLHLKPSRESSSRPWLRKRRPSLSSLHFSQMVKRN
jgi:hypothetical protein